MEYDGCPTQIILLNHASKILLKLGVHSRTEAARIRFTNLNIPMKSIGDINVKHHMV
jgi:hypothetical protein